MFHTAHMEALKGAVQQRKLIIVAGAGVSRDAGLPLWSDLIRKRMPSFLRKRGAAGKKMARKMLAVADHPLHAAGLWWDWLKSSEESLKPISDFFKQTFLQAEKPTSNHRRIVELCRLAGPGIFTTNFDRLFEIESGRLLVRTPLDPSIGYMLAPGKNEEPTFLMKLHGTAENVTSIVLTTAQYAVQSERESYKAFFDAVQQNYTLLFVGYGGSDPDINQLRENLVDRFAGNLFNWYMLLDRPKPSLRESLNGNRVVVAEFNGRKDGYGAVGRLLESLLRVARENLHIGR